MQIKRFEFNYFSENTYLIYDDTKEGALIDCGALTVGEKEKLKAFIVDNNIVIKKLLNTHLHLDHALGIPFVYEQFGVRPEYSKLEEDLLPGLKEQARAFGFNLEDEVVAAGNYLNEKDVIHFGKMSFTTILVPGHSPGSLCFYSEEHACLFCGDVLFRGSVGRSDLWGGDHDLLIRGIKEKLLTLPENTVVYSGHGPSTTIKYEKDHNPFLR